MQSGTTSVHRGALLLSGVAAVALCYYGWSQYSQVSQAQPSAKLHRSNATHGRRRQRQRHTSQSPPATHDPLASAIEQLLQAEESGNGFGLFDNIAYVTDEIRERYGDALTLLPSRLDFVRDTIITELQLPQEEHDALSNIITTQFLDNFINAAFPRGYYIAGDVDALQQELAPMINPDQVRRFIGTVYPLDDPYVGHSPPNVIEATEPLPTVENVTQALASDDNVQTSRSHRPSGDTSNPGEGQEVLDLLFRIGEEQAKRNGYQHQGVKCNGCSMQPITGIRYHCANCGDYDLCEMCEAQQIHIKTHVFYKIRIPAPTRGQIKLVQPKWYPGEPNACPESIPERLREQILARYNDLNRPELDAFYDQFRCIAGKAFPNDPDGIGMAIDRAGFNQYFTSTTADRAPPPNLIYDRIFAFYDADGNGLISFSEYAKGMAELAYNKSREARIQRLFKAFDINRDGYVERRDFLHLLQAHYNLSKEVTQEMLFARWDGLTDEEIQEVIQGNNPISAAFGGSSFAGHLSRNGAGKHLDDYGDFIFNDDHTAILKEDSQMVGDRARAIARQASPIWPQVHRLASEQRLTDEPLMAVYVDLADADILHSLASNADQIREGPGAEDVDRLGQLPDERWLESNVEQQDVLEALGTGVPIEEIMDPVDRQRVLQARQERRMHDAETQYHETQRVEVAERWQRRQFYLDEEQGLKPPAGYHEPDSSDDEESEGEVMDDAQDAPGAYVQRPSIRSRSSSKVRFDDSAMQSEMETKSEVSSRHTPLNERWGGVEFGQADRDTGTEIIYEAVQEAFNDMLDHFFKEQENKCMAARATRAVRAKNKIQLDAYERSLVVAAEEKELALIEADMERTTTLLNLLQNGGANGPSLERKPSPPAGVEIENPSNGTGMEPEIEVPDPTLPQNRPDADELASISDTTHDFHYDFESGDPEVQFAFRLWHEHNLIDRQAEARQGYGRLNIDEFKRKLQDKDTNDIDIGAESDEERGYWEAKADLGKWNFLSSWIEMGSF